MRSNDVRVREDTPVRIDTKASVALKGITGVVLIELNGGDPSARNLLAVTPERKVSEILLKKAGLKAMLDDLPKLIEKSSAIEDQVKRVATSADRFAGGNLRDHEPCADTKIEASLAFVPASVRQPCGQGSQND